MSLKRKQLFSETLSPTLQITLRHNLEYYNMCIYDRVRFPALPEKKVVGLERGPLSLVSTTEELLDKKRKGSYLENREYGRRDPSRWPRGTLYPQKLAITSPTRGGRSVGIVRSRTQTMEFSLVYCIYQ
jgi:hypothetical protein